jgi:hypothetical protein
VAKGNETPQRDDPLGEGLSGNFKVQILPLAASHFLVFGQMRSRERRESLED